MQWTDGYGLVTEDGPMTIVDSLSELDWLVEVVEEKEA